MKNGLHINPFTFKAALLFTCFMLVMLYNKTRAAALTAEHPVSFVATTR